jgi:NitT/TauT family transport system permease protein
MADTSRSRGTDALSRFRQVRSVRHVSVAGAGVASFARGVAGAALLALAIQLLAVWGPKRWAIPTLDELAHQVKLFVGGDPTFVTAMVHSMATIGLGLLVALVVGVAVGLALGLSRTAYQAMVFLLELVRPVPAVAVIPVMILAFGQNSSMEVAVIAFGAWWPIMFNTLYGVRSVDPVTVETARAFGLSRRRVISRVVLPSILPMIVTGLRIAAPLALILAVGAEYLATAGQGLGGVLITATSTGDLEVLWAAAVVTGAMGLVLGGLVWVAGRVLCPWVLES